MGPSEIGKEVVSHMTALRRYAIALAGDATDADDILQDCFLRALSRTHVWGQVRNPRAYLFTILHNAHVDRTAAIRRGGQKIALDDIAEKLPCQPDQLSRLEARDAERAFEDLPASYRGAVRLVGFEEMSYRQAADKLGVPIGTVMSRLSRGRRIMRRAMDGAPDRPVKA